MAFTAEISKTPRSSVANNSAPYVQVQVFCQMKLLCRSMLPESRTVRASKPSGPRKLKSTVFVSVPPTVTVWFCVPYFSCHASMV